MSQPMQKGTRILIMAGGTGGHVFPALAVARQFHALGAELAWLGTANGIEARIVPQEHYIDLHYLSVKGVRNQGLSRLLLAPFKILFACVQAAGVLRQIKPHLVLGMGGFASGPGGLMAKLMGYPLVIHEQNALPGFTNRILSLLASRVLQAFPGTFAATQNAEKYRVTGNPIRREIAHIAAPEQRYEQCEKKHEINILILGGSQGAQALNEMLPSALSKVGQQAQARGLRLNIWHQAGQGKDEKTLAMYQALTTDAKVTAFVNDMDQAYAWAHLIIARSGALTVSEIQQAGVAAVFVPYPAATDDHQTRNAQFLEREGAAIVVQQKDLNSDLLEKIISDLLDVNKLKTMALAARKNAPIDATNAVVDTCLELINA